MDLRGRSFLTLKDYTKEEILYLIALARELKKKKNTQPCDPSMMGHLLAGNNIVLIFDKSSTRTRCSFEVACFDEGAGVTYLTNSQMGRKESLEDTAKVLGRLYDGIEYRGYDHSVVEDLAKYSGVPVFNGLTDDDHPTQVLADFLTAMEHIDKPLDEMKLCYVGDGRNNVANALFIGATKVGMDFAIASPPQLFPSQDLVSVCSAFAQKSGSAVTISGSIDDAVKGADIIYTDIWCSMGEEDKMAERISLLKPYQVTRHVMEATGNPSCIFEHCLPSFHDMNTSTAQMVYEKFGLKEMEVTDEVFRSPASVVFDEAENRMHTIKAVLVASLCTNLRFSC